MSDFIKNIIDNEDNLSEDEKIYYANLLNGINVGILDSDDDFNLTIESFDDIASFDKLSLEEKTKMLKVIKAMMPYYKHIISAASDDYSYTSEELFKALASYLAAMQIYNDKINSLSKEEKTKRGKISNQINNPDVVKYFENVYSSYVKAKEELSKLNYRLTKEEMHKLRFSYEYDPQFLSSLASKGISSKEELENLIGLIRDIDRYELVKKYRDFNYKGTIEPLLVGPVTGVPSIDQPWNKKYNEDIVNSDIPERTMYEDLVENAKDYPDNIAINYFGKKITYRELISNIDRVASSLLNEGVKEGETVSLCMPFLPETVYLIYAINKIGARCSLIDPRINANLIKQYLNDSNSDYVFVVDRNNIIGKNKIIRKVKSIIDETGVKKTFSVSPYNSLDNLALKMLFERSNKGFNKWSSFYGKKSKSDSLKNESNQNSSFVNEDLVSQLHDEIIDKCACIIYTSGTSGPPKGVKLSNRSFSALSYIQRQMLKNEIGDKFLLIMPPFIAYGLVIGMHNMLCHGQELIMIPKFDLKKATKQLKSLIKKYEPQYIMGVPNFLLAFMQYDGDLSFLKGLILGGDKLSEKFEQSAKEFLRKKGCKAQICVGWGMTEIASCGSFSMIDESDKTLSHRQIGSIGYPILKSNIKILPLISNKKSNIDGQEEIYDIDGPELSYGQRGLLFIKSPGAMLGYLNDVEKELKRKVVYTDKNGDKWINTGDIMAIDQLGNLFFFGRDKRIIVRHDGHNIPTDKIENIATMNNDVENAVVVGVKCHDKPQGSFAVACIKLKDNNKSNEEAQAILYNVSDAVNSELQPRDRAKCYIVVDEIPMTPNLKVDYRKLEELAKKKTEGLNINYDDDSENKIIYINGDSIKKNTFASTIVRRLKRKKAA